jgi:hypothetical protein
MGNDDSEFIRLTSANADSKELMNAGDMTMSKLVQSPSLVCLRPIYSDPHPLRSEWDEEWVSSSHKYPHSESTREMAVVE